MAVSGFGVGATGVGLIFFWSAIKGASVTQTLRDLMSGKQPSGANVNPITAVSAADIFGGAAGIAGSAAGAAVAGSARAAQILQLAAAKKGQAYCFGGGHSGNPCAASCTDCSGFVSCVLNEAGVMHGSMATGGLSGLGVGVPYANRAPGDLIVWNGGTGGGHVGIIIDQSHMWNNPCTGCGGVQISSYPFGSRSAAAAVIRRVA